MGVDWSGERGEGGEEGEMGVMLEWSGKEGVVHVEGHL